MRLIGELEDARLGEIFAAYLVTLGISAKSDDSEDGKCLIWAVEEDQLQQAKQELASFLENPAAASYSNVIPAANKIQRQTVDKQKRIQKKISTSQQRLSPKPRLTLALIGICVAVGLFTNFGERIDSALFRSLAFLGVEAPRSFEVWLGHNQNPDSLSLRMYSIRAGEIWRTVTPALLHHGVIHLLFNMIWLFQLGRMIELRYGWWKYLLLVLVIALLSNLAQVMMPLRFGGAAPGFTEQKNLLIGLGGMSGVVYGIFGFVWIKSMIDPTSRFYLSQSSVFVLLIWLVFCMLPGPDGALLSESMFGVSVANWAHAVGLLVGILVAFLPFDSRKKRVPNFLSKDR
jgi:GlpG protein